jgi:type I restriction enzyme R subunit
MQINPKYYARMSEILEQLILDRKKGVIANKNLLELYAELAKNVANSENNAHYPESVRRSGANRMFYDNCGEDNDLAIRLDMAVCDNRQDGFRTSQVKQNRNKQEQTGINRNKLALLRTINDANEVERLFKLIMAQEEC